MTKSEAKAIETATNKIVDALNDAARLNSMMLGPGPLRDLAYRQQDKLKTATEQAEVVRQMAQAELGK